MTRPVPRFSNKASTPGIACPCPSEIKRPKALGDGFGFCSVVEMLDHDIEQYLAVAHPDNTMFVHAEGDGIFFDC